MRGFDGKKGISGDIGYFLQNDLNITFPNTALQMYLGLDVGRVATKPAKALPVSKVTNKKIDNAKKSANSQSAATKTTKTNKTNGTSIAANANKASAQSPDNELVKNGLISGAVIGLRYASGQFQVDGFVGMPIKKPNYISEKPNVGIQA